MCGICGVVYANRTQPVEMGLVEAMMERLAHRGPSGAGKIEGIGAALGHRRLAVIDLSAAGAQPLPNEDGTVFVVVNGEIYNHRELRSELVAKGHRFRSRSDSEVVVHLYEERGIEAIERLEGMFAIGLWDGNLEALLLARDAFGEKPLYYHESRTRLSFASEVGALLADPELVRTPDDLAIHHYLTYRYVPSPYTGLRGVRKLPPGHLLLWERGRGSLKRWSSIPRPAEARARRRADRGDESARVGVEEVRGAIARAVSSRLESDVPLGVLLSGGLDSAIVAFEAAKILGPGALRTFTVGFEEADYDESEPARLAAEKIGSIHRTLRVRADIAAELPAIVARYGEPFGDSSAAAVWLLAREVKRHVTVALGGDGGDELFGGYDRHRALRLFMEMRRSGTGALLPLAGRLASRLPGGRGRRNWLGRLERFARGASIDPHEANCAWLACFADGQKRALYTEEIGGRMSGVDSLNLLRRFYLTDSDILDDVLYADLSMGLPDDMLFKVDIAAMASALEVRSPFLDRALAEVALATPAARKIGRRRGKKILREAYAGLLPARTLSGAKAGFGLPVDRWLRGPLREMSRDLLLGGRCTSRGYFEPRAIEDLLREHESGRENHDDRIWALLCLELWFRRIVELGS